MDNHTIEELHPVVRYVLFSYSVLLIFVGTISNIVLIIVLTFKINNKNQIKQQSKSNFNLSNRNSDADNLTKFKSKIKWRWKISSTANFLLILISIMDTSILLILVLRYSIHLATDKDIRTINDFFCYIHTYLSMVSTNMSLALLCLFAGHRAIAMHWPFFTRKWFTSTKLYAIVIFISLIILIKQIPVLLFFRVISYPSTNNNINQTECNIIPSKIRYAKFYYYFEFGSHTIMGYFVLIVFNVLLFITLTIGRKFPNKSMITNNNELIDQSKKSSFSLTTNHNQGASAAKLLLCLSIFQVITSTPSFVLIELSGICQLNLISLEYELLVFYISFLLVCTNSSLNYFVYLIISKQFRLNNIIFFKHIQNKIIINSK